MDLINKGSVACSTNNYTTIIWYHICAVSSVCGLRSSSFEFTGALQKCSRYLGYCCCKLLTLFWDFEFWAITKLFECPNNSCIKTSHISIYKMKEQHNCNTSRHKSRHPSQFATLSVTNCDTVINCDDQNCYVTKSNHIIGVKWSALCLHATKNSRSLKRHNEG